MRGTLRGLMTMMNEYGQTSGPAPTSKHLTRRKRTHRNGIAQELGIVRCTSGYQRQSLYPFSDIWYGVERSVHADARGLGDLVGPGPELFAWRARSTCSSKVQEANPAEPGGDEEEKNMEGGVRERTAMEHG